MNDIAIKADRSNSRTVTTAVLYGLVIALAVASGVLFYQLDGLKSEMTKTKGAILNEIAQVRETSSVTVAANRERLESLRADLEATRSQASMAASSARKEAAKHASQLVQKLQQEQVKQAEEVRTELTQVKESATTAHAKISDVTTDVGNVKTEVASTKSELEKTIGTLKSVQGDLGVQSGLIATNATELAALRAMGERNYYEFDLPKTKEMQRVGDVAVRLKKADTKRNRYTIELVADDKRVEKKDKTVNEPVQFYVAGTRQPHEIVVNEVRKDRIVGYLATPKVIQARRG